MSVSAPATQVVDSASGRLLYRNPLGDDASGERTGLVFKNYPGAKRGGTTGPVSLTGSGWLAARRAEPQGQQRARLLRRQRRQQGEPVEEEVAPLRQATGPFKIKSMSFCKEFPCSWNPDKPFSWRVNRAQNTTQVFFFVNRWHDHLLAKPIGFTEAAGNFENVNSTGQGKGRDAVETQTHGRRQHRRRPARRPPRRQRQHEHPARRHAAADADVPPAPARDDVLLNDDPFPAINTGDEANTVYHEYTHGLSNRLVVDANGNSTLGPIQAGAMGEAWGDWYANDYLVSNGLEVDKKGDADLDIYQYDGLGAPFLRTQGMDCAPSSPGAQCPGGATRPLGRVHLRRLRQGDRPAGGAR